MTYLIIVNKEDKNMIKKIRTIHWLVALLVLGLAIGLVVSCGDDDDDDDDDTLTFTVELSWTNAVNMDLQIEEPTGEVVDVLGTGPTVVSIGDNNCGFGTSCDPDACDNLPCDSRERAEVSSATTGTYTILVEHNEAAGDELVNVEIAVPRSQVPVGEAYHMILSCNVPAASVQPIATLVFPNSVITNVSATGAAVCTVPVSDVR
jgi:hypothetical protein